MGGGSRRRTGHRANGPAVAMASHAVVTPAVSSKQRHPQVHEDACNSGACRRGGGEERFRAHAARYDPEADYETITRAAAGRRVNKLEPAKSLILLKPTETLPHMGGKRFEVGSPETRCWRRGSRGMLAPQTPIRRSWQWP